MLIKMLLYLYLNTYDEREKENYQRERGGGLIFLILTLPKQSCFFIVFYSFFFGFSFFLLFFSLLCWLRWGRLRAWGMAYKYVDHLPIYINHSSTRKGIFRPPPSPNLPRHEVLPFQVKMVKNKPMLQFCISPVLE